MVAEVTAQEIPFLFREMCATCAQADRIGPKPTLFRGQQAEVQEVIRRTCRIGVAQQYALSLCNGDVHALCTAMHKHGAAAGSAQLCPTDQHGLQGKCPCIGEPLEHHAIMCVIVHIKAGRSQGPYRFIAHLTTVRTSMHQGQMPGSALGLQCAIGNQGAPFRKRNEGHRPWVLWKVPMVEHSGIRRPQQGMWFGSGQVMYGASRDTLADQDARMICALPACIVLR